MSSSPHYCKYIWHFYPKYRKCVHFLLEWVNVSFYTYVVDVKLPCLSPITKRVKSKVACWNWCTKGHRRFPPQMISSEKICSQIDLWRNNSSSLPSLSELQPGTCRGSNICPADQRLSWVFTYWNTYSCTFMYALCITLMNLTPGFKVTHNALLN